MKKLLAMLMAVVMLFGCVAFAEDETAETVNLNVTVYDADGNVMTGIRVWVRDVDGETVSIVNTDANGQAVIEVAPAVYTVRATDTTDNYSTQESVNVEEETNLDLIIRKLVPGSEVTVGSLTKVSGDFSTDLFGNNTSDVDIRAMLHGYSTVAFTNDASYDVNETVCSVIATSEDGGNKTYTFAVAAGLTYNDGTALDARDYVFSVLMQSSPAIAAIGGIQNTYSSLVGYDDYAAGNAAAFTGVRLIDNYTFSLTIKADALPFYYELTYVNVTPYPISVIAPGCEVADDGNGAYITGGMTSDLLASTMLDENTGYVSHPSVTSGPYYLESYDAETGTVVMKANLNYVGNYEGKRPVIETVTLKVTTNEEALAQVQDGTLDIVNKVSDNTVITNGTALSTDAVLQTNNYLRSGLGFVSFACEEGPTSDVLVRQAVSYALDQDTFVSDYTGTNGMSVYSWYGLGQWMASDSINEMDQYCTVYAYDLISAQEALRSAGYTLDANGEEYVEPNLPVTNSEEPSVVEEDLTVEDDGTEEINDGSEAEAADENADAVVLPESPVRYREMSAEEVEAYNAQDTHIVEAVTVGDKTLMPLQAKIANVTDSGLCTTVVADLVPALKALGFDVQLVDMSFTQALSEYYRQNDRSCNMYPLATNFTFIFDPTNEFNGAEEYQGAQNKTGINDAELLKDAQILRSTTPGDEETYIESWKVLMGRYSDLLPALPLYSNVYYDFFANDIQDYQPSAMWSWSAAILYTWIGEAAAETVAD